MIKLWQFTDTHYWERDPMPAEPPGNDQKSILESGAILDAALAEFLAEPDCDILLISGDLTCNGHAQEHRGLLKKLRAVQAAGKRVILITATHDYGHTHIDERNDEGLAPLERPDGKVFRHELRELYDEFGFRDAIAEYGDGLSYVARLAPGYRLLCLNDDGDGRAFCGFYEPQMEWILAQIEQAKREGDYIFGMCHHPSYPPTPMFPLISSRDMLGDWEAATRRLANAGLRCMLSGHTHMHNIHPVVTPEGNPYWDLNTACLVGFPGVFREITLDNGLFTARNRYIKDFDWDRKGLTVREYLARQFDSLLRTIIESAAYDIDRLADHAGGFSVEKEVIYKYRLPITLAGKYVNRATLGSLGRLLLCARKIPKSVKKASGKELFLELVRNIYAGEERYGPDTDMGKALLAIAARADKLVGKRLPSAISPLPDFLLSLIYDESPDDYVEIAL